MTRIVFIQIILQFVFSFIPSTTNAQNVGFASGEVRYIVDKINTTTSKTIILNGGTEWGMNHFIIEMPGDDVIIIYSDSNLLAVSYIDGKEKNVKFLGTTYDPGALSPNSILRYRIGSLSYITSVDTAGSLIELEGNTYWYVKPDQRAEVKDWFNGDRIILDESENFIINLRFNEVASVVQAEIKFLEP